MGVRHFVRSNVWRLVVALLTACGVFGVAAPAGQASPGSALTWAERHPAKSPAARSAASMAYDGASRQVVLFGGLDAMDLGLRDTWTWNGSTWSKRHPASSPPAEWAAAMAYDGATRQVVLFGGVTLVRGRLRLLDGTWTWNGSTWTKRHPSTSPPRQINAVMAYDAATRELVLFGGTSRTRDVGGTWTWNGSTWSKRHPAKSPPAEVGAAMAYDAASRQVVLFGGVLLSVHARFQDGTWTWNGSSWTRRHPAASPPANAEAAMAYDAATRQVVLFGGAGRTRTGYLDGTWTWNGSTWSRRHPAASPPAREAALMADDAAAGNVLLFGGFSARLFDDTWTWR